MKFVLNYNISGEVEGSADDPIDAQAEFDSMETIDALERTIHALGHDVVRIGNIFGLIDYLTKQRGIDMVFNISEGLHGRSREAQVPALLEAYRIPYTFSDPLTLTICHDKSMAKRFFTSAELPTPRSCVVATPEALARSVRQLPPYPVMVKPIHEGSSKGIGNESVVTDDQTLQQLVRQLIESYKQPVLIEEFMPGREFTVGLVGTAAEARVIGAMEILLTDPSDIVYGYQTKEECEQRVAYAPVTEQPLLNQLSELALQAYTLLQCRDAGRIDLRLDAQGAPHILELNPLPGMHPTQSNLPIIAAMHGLSHRDLVALIVQSAIQRVVATPGPYRGA